MIWILLISNIVSFAALVWLTSRHILALENRDSYVKLLENCIDTLDRSYVEISNVMEIPVAFDDPYIRLVINAVKNSREAVVKVADKLNELQDVENDNE